jgi:hypothetical protein
MMHQFDALVAAEAGARGLDQPRRGIDARHVRRFRLQQQRDEHALAAAQVEDPFAGHWREQPHRGGQDDVAVVVGALVADELVIPPGDLVPALFASGGALFRRWRAGALPRFLRLGLRAFAGK